MKRLLTLREIMERFRIKELLEIIESLCDCRSAFALRASDTDSPVSSEHIDDVKSILVKAETISLALALPYTVKKIRHSQQYFTGSLLEITEAAAETEIRNIEESIRDGLDQYQFIKIAPGREIYVERYLLGKIVHDKFPSSVSDIREAKACLMAGCDTAAVFPLMRVVEWGLRALCVHLGFRKLKAKIKKSGVVIFRPVEYSEWEKVLDALHDRVDKKINRMKRGSRKQADQEFYYPILQDIRGTRDAWRNHVMHTRATYTPKAADARSEERRVGK